MGRSGKAHHAGLSRRSRGLYVSDMTKGVLRFFFEYGAGGCLWAGVSATLDRLDVGPVDAERRSLDGRIEPARLVLSDFTRNLRDQLDFEHSGYLNPLYPPDPSLWSQDLCDRFNANVDKLLCLLRQELDEDYDILDKQQRYAEDDQLEEYLASSPGLTKLNKVKVPTVR